MAVALTASGMGRQRAEPPSALEALVAKAGEGDARAFDRLMIETQDRVLSVGWRLLGNREDARDAAQETFVRVYKSLARFRAGQDPMGWIYRIAVNVCKDARAAAAPVADCLRSRARRARSDRAPARGGRAARGGAAVERPRSSGTSPRKGEGSTRPARSRGSLERGGRPHPRLPTRNGPSAGCVGADEDPRALRADLRQGRHGMNRDPQRLRSRVRVAAFRAAPLQRRGPRGDAAGRLARDRRAGRGATRPPPGPSAFCWRRRPRLGARRGPVASTRRQRPRSPGLGRRQEEPRGQSPWPSLRRSKRRPGRWRPLSRGRTPGRGGASLRLFSSESNFQTANPEVRIIWLVKKGEAAPLPVSPSRHQEVS